MVLQSSCVMRSSVTPLKKKNQKNKNEKIKKKLRGCWVFCEGVWGSGRAFCDFKAGVMAGRILRLQGG
jgi:hypothetical protein